MTGPYPATLGPSLTHSLTQKDATVKNRITNVGIPNEQICVKRYYQRNLERTFRMIDTGREFHGEILDCLRKRTKIAVCCKTQRNAVILQQLFKDEVADTEVILLTKNTDEAIIRSLGDMNVALEGMYLVIMTSKVTVGVEYTELWGKLFIDMTGYKGATVAQLFQMIGRFRNVEDTEILVRMPVRKDYNELSKEKVARQITEWYKEAGSIEVPGKKKKIRLTEGTERKKGPQGEAVKGVQYLDWHWLCETMGDVESEGEVHLNDQRSCLAREARLRPCLRRE
jgi:Origin of replication binding protein